MSALERTSAGAWMNIRRWLLRVHLWIGIAFCIPFAVLGVTGSYLVYDQDFTAPPRATAVGEYKAPTAIIGAAMAANPDKRATTLSMPLVAGDPAIVRVANGAGRGARATTQIFVDPVSLEVLGAREGVRTRCRISCTACTATSWWAAGTGARSSAGWASA